MLKINILTFKSYAFFSQEFDEEKYGNIFEVYENSHADIVWDVVIVYENVADLTQIKCRKGGLVFISGEPPLSKEYPKDFMRKFDFVLTTHKNIKHPNLLNSQLALNWHYGLSFKTKEQRYSFAQIASMPLPQKSKLISVITSSKEVMPGHNYRQNIISQLKKEFSDYIDFYGRGSNPIDCKCDAINPYMFHICMENTMIPHYWSEKFADPNLGYAVPIYAGCPNIEDYFNSKGFIKFDMRNYKSIQSVIQSIIQDPQKLYNDYYAGMLENRNRLIHQYTIFDVLHSLLETRISLSDTAMTTEIIPYEKCKHYKLIYTKMSIKRKILKYLIQLKGRL